MPSHEEIEPHTHPNISSILFFFLGDCVIFKNTKVEYLRKFHFYKILPNDKHGFAQVIKPLIFLNFQKWLNNTQPTSASVDFKTYGT